MKDEHRAFVDQLIDYRKCLEMISEEACSARDYEAARQCVVSAMKLHGTINAFEAMFADANVTEKEDLAARALDRSVS